MDCPEFAAQSMPTAPVQAIVPSIGPLHVSLNAREDFMINYHDFFKYIYENIFQGSKLADKPKPWRTSLILEIVYGGWTLICQNMIGTFQHCKHPLYAVFLNLLDSHRPLVLSIYCVTFKRGQFSEYWKDMKSAWLLCYWFYCFRRHHYEKVPLLWISNLLFWKHHDKSLHDNFVKFLNTTDEFGVENVDGWCCKFSVSLYNYWFIYKKLLNYSLHQCTTRLTNFWLLIYIFHVQVLDKIFQSDTYHLRTKQ